MSVKKVTDKELAKISGAADKPGGIPPADLDPGSGGGNQPDEPNTDAPGADPADFQRT